MSSAYSLDALFPEPTRYPPSRQSPAKLAGATVESTQTLLRLLRHNKEHHHIFFNEKEFHNHATHHLLALYVLGASSDLLEAAYKTHEVYQLPAFPPLGEITYENYADHVGDQKWFPAYFDFFAKEVLSKGASETVEKYVFSKEANYESGAEAPKEMLARFIGGFLHSMIHLGYGLEFGIPYMVTEALALTAIASDKVSALTPPSLWDETVESSVIPRLSNLVLNKSTQNGSLNETDDDVSIFNVFALIQQDASFSHDSLNLDPSVDNFDLLINSSRATDILRYADMWALNIPSGPEAEEYVEHKIKELAFAAALVYGVGGWKTGKIRPFEANFITMHLVTSSLFLPSICAYLSPLSTQMLLRAYFSSMIGIWISRGRPALNITEDFLSSTSTSPQERNAATKPAKDTLTPGVVSPNPWLAITQSVLQNPAEHFPKTQRSLMHWANLYGTDPAGEWATGKVRLEGIERLDGTIFVRVAGITADALGWMREGQERGQFSFGLLTN